MTSQAQPFRKSLAGCLYYHMSKLVKIPELERVKEKIKAEHLKNEKKDKAELEAVAVRRRRKS